MFKSLLLRHAVIARRNDEAIQGKRRRSYRTLRNRWMAQVFHILTLSSPLDPHHLMDRFVVPPRDDSPTGCADGSVAQL